MSTAYDCGVFAARRLAILRLALRRGHAAPADYRPAGGRRGWRRRVAHLRGHPAHHACDICSAWRAATVTLSWLPHAIPAAGALALRQ